MTRKTQTLPSDKLKAPRRPWRIAALIGVLVLAGTGGTVIGAAALAPDLGREQAAVRLVGGEGKPTTPQMTHKLILTTHVAKTEVPPPPPPPVYSPPAGGGGGGPVRCPAGSTANSNDGVNDTSCFPNVCYSISVPDPAHPECDYAFRP